MKLLFEKGVVELPAAAEPSFSSVKLAVRARGVDGGSVAGGVIAWTVVLSSDGMVAFNESRICLYPA